MTSVYLRFKYLTYLFLLSKQVFLASKVPPMMQYQQILVYPWWRLTYLRWLNSMIIVRFNSLHVLFLCYCRQLCRRLSDYLLHHDDSSREVHFRFVSLNLIGRFIYTDLYKRWSLTFVFEDIVRLFYRRLSDEHPLLLLLGVIPMVTHVSLYEVAAVSHVSSIYINNIVINYLS